MSKSFILVARGRGVRSPMLHFYSNHQVSNSFPLKYKNENKSHSNAQWKKRSGWLLLFFFLIALICLGLFFHKDKCSRFQNTVSLRLRGWAIGKMPSCLWRVKQGSGRARAHQHLGIGTTGEEPQSGCLLRRGVSVCHGCFGGITLKAHIALLYSHQLLNINYHLIGDRWHSRRLFTALPCNFHSTFLAPGHYPRAYMWSKGS